MGGTRKRKPRRRTGFAGELPGLNARLNHDLGGPRAALPRSCGHPGLSPQSDARETLSLF